MKRLNFKTNRPDVIPEIIPIFVPLENIFKIYVPIQYPVLIKPPILNNPQILNSGLAAKRGRYSYVGWGLGGSLSVLRIRALRVFRGYCAETGLK
ncbi:hypothetical protein [Dysgonomonas termitidis]|uniref:Uncharacterized protein n=1 Tax=Dysgonomonas termitidis TaxID=1516126 RepID=A0ABV9KRC9_9BACT